MLLDSLPIFWPSCFYHFTHSSGFLPPLTFNSLLSPASFHSSSVSPFSFPPLFFHFPFIFDSHLILSFVPELCLRPVARIASPRAYPNFCSGSEYFYSPLPCGGMVTSCTLNSDRAGQAQALAEDIVLYSGQGTFSQCSSLYPCI